MKLYVKFLFCKMGCAATSVGMFLSFFLSSLYVWVCLTFLSFFLSHSTGKRRIMEKQVYIRKKTCRSLAVKVIQLSGKFLPAWSFPCVGLALYVFMFGVCLVLPPRLRIRELICFLVACSYVQSVHVSVWSFLLGAIVYCDLWLWHFLGFPFVTFGR